MSTFHDDDQENTAVGHPTPTAVPTVIGHAVADIVLIRQALEEVASVLNAPSMIDQAFRSLAEFSDTMQAFSTGMRRQLAMVAEIDFYLSSPEFTDLFAYLPVHAERISTQTAQATRFVEMSTHATMALTQTERRASLETYGGVDRAISPRVSPTDSVSMEVVENAHHHLPAETRLFEPLTVWQVRFVWFVVFCLPAVLLDQSNYLGRLARENPALVTALMTYWLGFMLEQRAAFHERLGAGRDESET